MGKNIGKKGMESIKNKKFKKKILKVKLLVFDKQNFMYSTLKDKIDLILE